MDKIKSRSLSNESIYAIPYIITLFTVTLHASISVADNTTGFALMQNPTRFILLGIAYLISLFFVIRNIKFAFRLYIYNIPIALLVVYSFLSTYWSSYPQKVIINWGHFVGIILVVTSLLFYAKNDSKKVFYLISCILFIAISSSLVVCLFFPDRGIFQLNGRWMGLTNNPNSLGVLCFISIWLNTSILCFFSQNFFLKIFCLISISISTVLLIGSNSITSIFCSLFCGFSIVYYRFIYKNKLSLLIVKVSLVITMLTAFCLFIIIIRPDLLTVDGVLETVGRGRSLTGRLKIWADGIDYILEKFWFGWSFDSLSSLGKASLGQFHNGYIDLGVRGGVLGLFLVFSLLLHYFVKGISILKKHNDIVILFFILTVATLAHNLTEASLMKAANLQWIMLLTSYFHFEYLHHIRTRRENL